MNKVVCGHSGVGVSCITKDGWRQCGVDAVESELATKEQNHAIFRKADENGEILMSRETSQIQKDED